MGSDTRCYFVNPRYGEVADSPCYPSLDALPERPDTALVALNPLRAAQVTEEAAKAGIPSVVIPGGGVVEGGEAAARMQEQVRRIAIEHGMALLGPNCMGVVDFVSNAATYIGDVSPWLPRGGVAAIAQSGSVTDAFIHSGTRIGFSRIIGSGSEIVLDVCDHLAYCLDDPATTAVILFVEGFRRPERFLALADRALAAGVPIAMVKVGRSAQAQEASIAHSGTLAGEDRAIDAGLAAAGVIRCGDLDELLEQAELLAGCRRLDRAVGAGRTGVVTVSTGEASLIADLAPRTGIDLPPIPAAARAALLERLPTLGYVGNPLDPWGAADAPVAYSAAFETLAASGAYDVLAVVHDSPYRELAGEVEVDLDVTKALLGATRDRPEILPVHVSLTSGEISAEVKAVLDAAGGAPMLRGAVEAFSAIARAAWSEARHAVRTTAGPAREGWPALAADRTRWAHEPEAAPGDAVPLAALALPERESLDLLASAGVPTVQWVAAADVASAVAAAHRIGYPVAVKVDAVGIAHKSDVGGVRINLGDGAAVAAAVPELLAAGGATGDRVRGVLVQAMVPPGVEMIVGARRDPTVGPIVLVGFGGVLAELLDDVAIRIAPVRSADARAMLEELQGAALLQGVRGRAAVDLDSLTEVIVAVGRLAVARPQVLAIDLNPVIATMDGAVAVDGLVVVAAG